jgi:hypothetical protein
MAMMYLGSEIGLEQSSDAPEEIFARLQEAYSFDPKVTAMLVKCGFQSLEDFKSAFDTGKEAAEKILQGIEGLEFPLREASRVKQAWQALCTAQETQVAIKRKGPEAVDLDSLLDIKDLNNMRDAFYNRYHLSFTADMEPSDHLLSKITKQMKHRLLQVFPVWKVRSLTHQVMSDTKRRKLGNGLEMVTDDPEGETRTPHTVHNYLQMLHLLMLAYARAGCNKLKELPMKDKVEIPESRSSDSTLYYEVPLDMVLKYHGRASKAVASMPPAQQLQWLERLDVEERQVWVEKHRASDDRPLGQIIKETFVQREPLWIVSTASSSSSREKQKPPPKAAPKAKVASGTNGGARFQAKSRGQFCRDWNEGKCSEPCPRKLVHACSAPIDKAKTKFCGLYNHNLQNCRRKVI